MSILKKIVLSLSVGGFSMVAGHAFAATIYLAPTEQSIGIGQEITVQVLIDSAGSEVNAAQAVIRFSSNVLNFVSADRSKSVFGFWVEDPTLSDGVLSFIAGTTDKASGNALQVFTAKFKAIGAGKADLSIGDAIVTAADGKGTNILTAAKGAAISVAFNGGLAPAPVVQTQPAVVTRVPVKSSKLPALPDLKVNLYPDSELWYNQQGEAIVLWNLPEDVTQLASSLDQNPKGVPTIFGKQLYTGNNFGELAEGVWYAHVRFKNNVGNGPVAHYRIAIDRTPPPAFEVVSVYGLETGNPQPVLTYSAKDALSGIGKYVIHIGSVDAVETQSEEVKLPILSPGRAEINVVAMDKAGNSANSSIILNILPLPSPAITYVSSDNFAGEGGLIIRGTSEKDQLVGIVIRDSNKSISASGAASVDDSGSWEILIDQPLKRGVYIAEAVSQDARGARSFPVNSAPFRVKIAPLLTIAGIGITPTWFAISLLILVIIAAVFGWFSSRLWKKKVSWKTVIAQRDASAFLNELNKDLEKMVAAYGDKVITPSEAVEIETGIRKIKDKIEKIGKFVTKGIQEISE